MYLFSESNQKQYKRSLSCKNRRLPTFSVGGRIKIIIINSINSRISLGKNLTYKQGWCQQRNFTTFERLGLNEVPLCFIPSLGAVRRCNAAIIDIFHQLRNWLKGKGDFPRMQTNIPAFLLPNRGIGFSTVLQHHRPLNLDYSGTLNRNSILQPWKILGRDFEHFIVT